MRGAATRRSSSSTVARTCEAAALGIAIVPAVVMVVRAAATGWVPLFDAAYFTVRSRDVLTSHNPLVGAWSMGSLGIGEWVNNLGPLQLALLAPFTKLDPYWGTALGVAVTNVAAIVGVWLVARRMFGPVGVVGAMAATVLIELNEGSLMLIEARQQLALVLPMWCLLWLAAAAWMGRSWALPWLVFVASLVLQTHFTYAYQAAAVTIGAFAAFLVHHRARLETVTRTLAISLAVAVVCWAQPLWDQLRGTGNLAAAVRQSGGSDRSVGASRGLRILAESVFLPPLFTPGSMGDLLRRGARPSLGQAIVAIGIWAVLLITAAVRVGPRNRGLAAMAWVGLVALGASILAVTKIPPTEQFGIIAQNYYWIWPMAIFMATAIIGSALRHRLIRLRPTTANAVLPGTVGVLALATIPLLSPTTTLPETDHEWSVSRVIARPFLDQLGDSLDDLDVASPVLVELGAVRHVRYTLLAELQRRDIDFRFRPGSTDLSRFGRRRCDDGTAASLLILRGGPYAVSLATGHTLVASVPGLTEAQSERSAELAELFGDAIRDGRVTLDDDAIMAFGGEIPVRLQPVRDTPGLDARRLSDLLANWRHFGAVEVARDLLDPLLEWQRLERQGVDDRMAIHLQPISPLRPNLCDDLEPGDP